MIEKTQTFKSNSLYIFFVFFPSVPCMASQPHPVSHHSASHKGQSEHQYWGLIQVVQDHRVVGDSRDPPPPCMITSDIKQIGRNVKICVMDGGES